MQLGIRLSVVRGNLDVSIVSKETADHFILRTDCSCYLCMSVTTMFYVLQWANYYLDYYKEEMLTVDRSEAHRYILNELHGLYEHLKDDGYRAYLDR
jgi:hypothetical protein